MLSAETEAAWEPRGERGGREFGRRDVTFALLPHEWKRGVGGEHTSLEFAGKVRREKNVGITRDGKYGGRRRREQAGCRAPGPRRRGRRSGGVPDAGEKGFPGEGVTDCIKRSGQVKSRTGQGDGHWSRRVEQAQEELRQEDTKPRQPSP